MCYFQEVFTFQGGKKIFGIKIFGTLSTVAGKILEEVGGKTSLVLPQTIPCKQMSVLLTYVQANLEHDTQ